MNKKQFVRGWYLAALVAPVAATLIGFGADIYLHHSSIAMFYLLAVLIVAVRTSTGPALFCAVSGFFLYNFFFTEPRYSLVIFHREDIITAGIFLVLAILAGHQAARLRQQLLVLQGRSGFAGIQLRFLEQLTGDIDNRHVLASLYTALTELSLQTCFIVQSRDQEFVVTYGNAMLDRTVRDRLAQVKTGKRPVYADSTGYFPLFDGIQTVAIAVAGPISGEVADARVLQEYIETLSGQASLVLARTRLAGDLDRERMEKERELLRSTLLTSVSHDLRTPLSSMIGCASSLTELDESLSAEQKKELLETILQEARRLDGYIQNLLDMTRLGYRGLRLERDWIGLDEILNVVMRRIRPLLSGRVINMKIAPDIPLLYVHAALIEQAIFNVLENAVRYSPAATAIEINAFQREGNAVIDIMDRGPGIPVAERERIFDMFHTLDRKDRHSAGTGLGLAICKGMLGAHGGSVEVLDQHTGQGAVFRLCIPISAVDPKTDEEML